MEEKSPRMGVDNISKPSVYSDAEIDRAEGLLNRSFRVPELNFRDAGVV